jgi:GntR family transcriptional regulator/MocR family aminotransferase
MRRPPNAGHPLVRLRKRGALQAQIVDELRARVLEGALPGGAPLPSSRQLAEELGVARNTVSAAYTTLATEGYLVLAARHRPRVAMIAPDVRTRAPVIAGAAPSPALAGSKSAEGRIARRAEALVAHGVLLRDTRLVRPFRTGLPPLDLFPERLWQRIVARQVRRQTRRDLAYAGPHGSLALRRALLVHLRATRGVDADPEQIFVTAGSQGALDLCARVVLDPGARAWIEDPGFLGVRGVLALAGARPVPVPVDAEGMDVSRARGPAPAAIVVSPSHQFPLGVRLTLARRLALLAAARAHGAWVIEDDYESEYRFEGKPLAALAALDPSRVLYIGTLSRILFPGLRLGYVVVPPPLVAPFAAVRAVIDRHPAALAQAAVTEMIVEGHFAAHIRRIREATRERWTTLADAARRDLAGAIDLAVPDGGSHAVGWLTCGMTGAAAAEAASRESVDVSPLARFAVRAELPPALVLGYGAYAPAQIRSAVGRLARALVTRSAGSRTPRRTGPSG